MKIKIRSDYSEVKMGDAPTWVREPSVKTVVKDNGNRTALEQWMLLTTIPAVVLTALYFAVRSQMTAETWWMLFTLAGIVVAVVAEVRFGRWHNVDIDPSKTRRPEMARVGLNILANAWPGVLLLIWQAVIVDSLALAMAERWYIVVAFIWLLCALFATVFFVARMIRELKDPLAGNSIEIGVRERELKQELNLAKLEAQKNKASAQYATQLEDEITKLKKELDRAKRSSRVIYANHGSARGDSSHTIDDNALFNQFVLEAFKPGVSRTRDEWVRWLVVDPTSETTTDGRERYDSYRAVLANAGLWNMKSGPVKSLEEACEALDIPLPQTKTASAGGRAGNEGALAVPPDWDTGAGG